MRSRWGAWLMPRSLSTPHLDCLGGGVAKGLWELGPLLSESRLYGAVRLVGTL